MKKCGSCGGKLFTYGRMTPGTLFCSAACADSGRRAPLHFDPYRSCEWCSRRFAAYGPANVLCRSPECINDRRLAPDDERRGSYEERAEGRRIREAAKEMHEDAMKLLMTLEKEIRRMPR